MQTNLQTIEPFVQIASTSMRCETRILKWESERGPARFGFIDHDHGGFPFSDSNKTLTSISKSPEAFLVSLGTTTVWAMFFVLKSLNLLKDG
jgi:hypothetical protein